jgi:hypothetical protein
MGFSVDFFVGGAPKCGTTSFCAALAAHEDISFSTPKETFYWGSDLEWFRRRLGITSPEQYSRAFAQGPRLKGEGTTLYLFSADAVEQIFASYPAAKFIFFVRNPLEAAYAYHMQLVNQQLEDRTDFAEAWSRSITHAQRPHRTRSGLDSKFLNYRDIAMFGDQLNRVLKIVPRTQVAVINYDEYKRNPDGTFESVLGFLGLPYRPEIRVPRLNESAAVRSGALMAILQHSFAKRALIGLRRTLPYNLIDRLTTAKNKVIYRYQPRSPLDTGLQERLRNELADDQKLLASLVGIRFF